MDVPPFIIQMRRQPPVRSGIENCSTSNWQISPLITVMSVIGTDFYLIISEDQSISVISGKVF